jgi:hypothetical protein
MRITYDGDGLGQNIENGLLTTNLEIPFFVMRLGNNNDFHFAVMLSANQGIKSPPLRAHEDAIVTFECTEGKPNAGNRLIKIVRPKGDL